MLTKFQNFGCYTKKQKGFSLIELSVIISIAAASAVGFLSWTQPENITDAKKAIETRKQIDKIENAIQAFRVEQNRLPCPADPYMRIDNTHSGVITNHYSSDFGTEDLDKVQTTVNGVLTLGIDCQTSQGAVPVQSLGLSGEYINDAWGRRFTYAVSPKLCGADGGTTPGAGLSTSASIEKGCNQRDYENNVGDITITDGSANITTSAAYVIISHGSDGDGAFLPSGTALAASTDDANEAENSDTDAITTFTFVKRAKNTTYDDIVYFKNKTQIERLTSRSNVKQVTVPECEANSQAIRNLVLSNASSMVSNITGYDHTSGEYNTGEQVALGLMMGLQNICVSYYGYRSATIKNQTWSGAQCPGNATANSTYSSKDNACTCSSKDWNGSCTMDWFAVSDLKVNTNLIMWLDAETPETIFDDSGCTDPAAYGEGVGCWKDKSTNNYSITSASEPDYVSKGINSKDSISFVPATSDHFNTMPNLSALTAGEMFIALKKNENLASSTINSGTWGSFGTAAEGHFPWLDDLIYDSFGTNVRKESISYKQNFVSNTLYNATSIKGEWQNRLNGIQLLSTRTNTVGFRSAPLLGKTWHGDAYFYGNIGEVLLYNTKLSTANRQDVHKYLGDKWNISIIPSLSTTSIQPVMWLDAADEKSVFTESTCTTLTDYTTIGCWKDKSQSGFNATISSASSEPTYQKRSDFNNKYVLKFDGSNDYLYANGVATQFNSDFTLFFAGDYDQASTTGGRVMLEVANTNEDVLAFFLGMYIPPCAGDNLCLTSQNMSSMANKVTNQLDNSDPPFIVSSVGSGRNTTALVATYYNGIQETSTLSFIYSFPLPASKFVIGADDNNGSVHLYFYGSLGEIIVYPSSLSDNDRKTVESYLSDKWGIKLDQ
jgi:type II secretory pathway pseudopilin PulG